MQLSPAPDAERHPCMDKLARREQQVFLAIACGEMAHVTAERLGLSVKTISTYRARALKKLALTSNQQCTAYAMAFGLLTVVIDLPAVELGETQNEGRAH
jgi:two-component system, NarL family, invasion response regulator UvrY